jgi:hypothetical protein
LWLTAETLAAELSTGGDIQITQTLNQLLGPQTAERYSKIIPADEEISWEVYLPSNDSTENPGVFVYVSPRKTGQIDSRWRSVMDQQNLIYISANKSGNKVLVNRRMILAIMANNSTHFQLTAYMSPDFQAEAASPASLPLSTLSYSPEPFISVVLTAGIRIKRRKLISSYKTDSCF